LPASVLALLMAVPTFAQQTNPPPAEAAPAAPDKKSETLVLSPFVVSTEKDSGYYAANTLAGSRMNTNLADLGASISVVTKQQMEDTASTDINDIFRYEVNTEGSLTYTPGILTSRSDGVLDANGGATVGGSLTPYTNAGANRVRGLGTPSAAVNYYPSIGLVPFDSYNTQSVEISRGPNSMLFGLGSPAGIANQSTAQAQLNRESANVSFRTDQYGSFRSSVDFNQSLVADRVAIYGAALYDDRRFDRKPAYDKTKRFYGALTVKPFKKTTIKANFEKYDNDNHRPNTLTPRDYVTQWNLAGQPYYDPATHIVYNKDGQALSMWVDSRTATPALQQSVRDFIRSLPGYNPALRGTSATNFNGTDTNFTFYNGFSIFADTNGFISPQVSAATKSFVAGQPSPNILYVPGISFSNQDTNTGRSYMRIADGQLVDWYQPTYHTTYLTGWGTATNPAANPAVYPTDADVRANPAWSNIASSSVTASGAWTGYGNGLGSYRYPGVTDRSIYDWRNVNISSMNFGSAKNKNYNLEFEQELPFNLFLSAGWFRQDYAARSNYTVGQLNMATLYVDTNKTLPDGTANPYFGKPYVQDIDPDSYYNEETDDHYRAMLAWTPDFTRNQGWTKWLGRHQVLGLWSSDSYDAKAIRQRLTYVAATSDAAKYRYIQNQNNNTDGTPTGWDNFPSNNSSLRRTFYLAAPGDPNGVVTRSAGYWNDSTFSGNIRAYDYASSSFQNYGVTTAFDDLFASTGRNQRKIESISGGITSYLWKDRLIATFGLRKDEYRARTTRGASASNPSIPALVVNGVTVEPAIPQNQVWVNGVLQRDVVFNAWNPYSEISGTTRTSGGVLRPFQGWTSIENRANSGSQFWQFVRSFGVSYNQSDNFNPPSGALGDFYGNALGKPVGKGKDYGFQFALFDNKLFARVTWFEASNENENIAAPQAYTRLRVNVDQTLFRNWARTIALINMGYSPIDNDNFGVNLSTTEENAVQQAAEKIWKLAYNYYETLPFALGATRNAEADGMEAEINYNPIPNWTMKFTFGKQDTKYASVVKEFTPWEADRMAVWKSAKASDYLLPQYQSLAKYNTTSDPTTGRDVDLTNFWSSYGYQSTVQSSDNSLNPEAIYNRDVMPLLMLDRDKQGQSVDGQRKYRWSFLTSYSFTSGRLRGFSIGGAERWEDKAVIGYLGKNSGATTAFYNGQPILDLSDVTKPVYDSANYYTDLWVSYRTNILGDKVGLKLQLNVNNVFEGGSLRAVAVNYDGSPYSFRIIDPRQYVLTARFEF
jgi:hypothetical protein